MSALSTQISQPVAFFYGVPAETEIIQSLEDGFDYVITCIRVSSQSTSDPGSIAVEDESGVLIFEASCGPASAVPDQGYAFSGEMPIGPRSELKILSSAIIPLIYIGGYALTPPTLLHV